MSFVAKRRGGLEAATPQVASSRGGFQPPRDLVREEKTFVTVY